MLELESRGLGADYLKQTSVGMRTLSGRYRSLSVWPVLLARKPYLRPWINEII